MGQTERGLYIPTLNIDSTRIVNFTRDKGYLKTWFAGGIADKLLLYNLDSGERKESISQESLFNPDSLNTAVGMPIVLNHPPQAVDGKNFRQFIMGTMLQEYANKDGTLLLAGIVHDEETADRIEKGEITHTSSAYDTPKTLNNDGVYMQELRDYNHFAVLSPEFIPRAGKESSIFILGGNNYDSKSETITQENTSEQPKQAIKIDNKNRMNTNSDTSSEAPKTNPQGIDPAEIQQRVELLTEWKKILDEHNVEIDYGMNSDSIRLKVLSCFYDEKTINELNQDASVAKGFWLNFVTNPDKMKKPKTHQETDETQQNQDALDEDAKLRAEYIEKVSGGKG